MSSSRIFRTRSTSAALLALGCGGGPQAGARADAPFDIEAARTVIAQRNKRFTEAHVAGNVAAIDSMFTATSRSYPPGAPAAIGLPAIHALTVDFLKAG